MEVANGNGNTLRIISVELGRRGVDRWCARCVDDGSGDQSENFSSLQRNEASQIIVA